MALAGGSSGSSSGQSCAGLANVRRLSASRLLACLVACSTTAHSAAGLGCEMSFGFGVSLCLCFCVGLDLSDDSGIIFSDISCHASITIATTSCVAGLDGWLCESLRFGYSDQRTLATASSSLRVRGCDSFCLSEGDD